MMTLSTVANKVYDCPWHGMNGTFHTEERFTLPIAGARGEYEQGETWEVIICDLCKCEVKPEPDYSQVMEMPY